MPTFTYAQSSSEEGGGARADINERVLSRGPGSASEALVLIPLAGDRLVFEWLFKFQSIKVTRVATNVLAEQTMSWEADGGGQHRGRMTSGGMSDTASSNPTLRALQPGEKINASPSATSPRGRPSALTSGTVFSE